MKLRESLDGETLPATVAGIPDLARQLVRQLGQRIAEEAAKKQKVPVGGGDGPSGGNGPTPPRKVRLLRPTEIATVTRVTNTEEWEQLSNKLDQRVRELLDEGFDVELG